LLLFNLIGNLLISKVHVGAHGSRLEGIHVVLFHFHNIVIVLVLVHIHLSALKILSGLEVRLELGTLVGLHGHSDASLSSRDRALGSKLDWFS
jgi:hypothetical protein